MIEDFERSQQQGAKLKPKEAMDGAVIETWKNMTGIQGIETEKHDRHPKISKHAYNPGLFLPKTYRCYFQGACNTENATKKNLRILSMKYWLFNKDPYFMVYCNPHIAV